MTGTQLTWLEVSPDMATKAMRNAREYGLNVRINCVIGNCIKMPFKNENFDAVFTNGSFHEWSEPQNALNEIYRVLKGGKFYIADIKGTCSSWQGCSGSSTAGLG